MNREIIPIGKQAVRPARNNLLYFLLTVQKFGLLYLNALRTQQSVEYLVSSCSLLICFLGRSSRARDFWNNRRTIFISKDKRKILFDNCIEVQQLQFSQYFHSNEHSLLSVQRIYFTDRMEMSILYALRKVNNSKCMKCWIKLMGRAKTSCPAHHP